MTTFVNARGKTISVDGDECPPGYGLKVPLMLMDPMQREVAQHYARPVHVVDAFGMSAGRKRGYCFPNTSSGELRDAAIDARDQADQAYADLVNRDQNAWCQGAAARDWLAEREAELLPVLRSLSNVKSLRENPGRHDTQRLCAQSSQHATWPPSAAVRQRSIALMTFIWSRLTCPALARRHAAPWSRKIFATSSTGRDMAAGRYAGGWSFLLFSLAFLGFFRGCDSRSSGLSMPAIIPVATRV
jgi:hypothetical protein